MPLRTVFVTSHPIQYQAPVFRELALRPELDFQVWFCHLPDARQQGEGFGVEFAWDLPLREGYASEVLRNVAAQPSVTEYAGCDTPEIFERLRAGNFDAVIVNGWVVKSCVQTVRACRRLKIPCLVRGEANLLRPRAWWKRLLHRQWLKQYAAFLTIGRANADFYRQHGAREEQLFPAPYCIENARYAAAATSPLRGVQFRQEFQLPADTVCFLFCAKFIDKKHPLELLQAFHKAHAAGMQARLVMVGDGELKNACQQFAEQHQLPVTFTGFLNQTQIANAYVGTDCLVLPSDHGETWGLVVNEAMACGRPAIVSDLVGCHADLISADTGAVFPFGDWDALSRQLSEFSGDRSRLQRLGENARRLIDNYSPKVAADGITRAVVWACGKKG